MEYIPTKIAYICLVHYACRLNSYVPFTILSVSHCLLMHIRMRALIGGTIVFVTEVPI